MERTDRGTEIIKKAESTVAGCKVILTRKTNKEGEIRHGVVLETRRGGHRRIGTFDGISKAYAVYKALANA